MYSTYTSVKKSTLEVLNQSQETRVFNTVVGNLVIE